MPGDDLWVFGYGSLMWEPGFPHRESRPALLRGYHRAFALYSRRAWGSRERPGLVAALLPGGSCRGHAFRLAPSEHEEVLAYLDRREGAYERRVVPVELAGARVRAATYVVDRSHDGFAGTLAPAEAARLIHQGVGFRGSSREYLANTVRHLDAFGIRGTPLHDLLARVEALDGG